MKEVPRFRSTELQLLFAPSLLAVVGLLTIFVVPRGDNAWTWGDIWVSLAFVGFIYAISLAFSLAGFDGDQVLFPITAMLAAMGLIVIQRLQPALTARGAAPASLAARQLVYLGLGLSSLAIIALWFRRFDWIRRYKYSWLLLSLVLLGFTFAFGEEVNGARLWLAVGPFRAQPSEVIKITLVTFMAAYLSDKRDLIGASWRLGRLSLPPVPYLLPMILMGVVSLAVIVIQNDLGTALLFFGVFLSMLYAASGRVVYVVLGLFSFVVACFAAYRLFDRIDLRVQNWLDPWQDPLVVGYQPIQSDFSLAAGGIFGTGLSQGKPYYIPEVQTDFVFSAIAEELGLLGTIAILALCLLLVLRGLLIALRVRDGFARLVAIGLASTLGWQTLIILGGIVRLIPLTGITLPFVSYGGSSLVTNFVIVGLLLAISTDPRRS